MTVHWVTLVCLVRYVTNFTSSKSFSAFCDPILSKVWLAIIVWIHLTEIDALNIYLTRNFNPHPFFFLLSKYESQWIVWLRLTKFFWTNKNLILLYLCTIHCTMLLCFGEAIICNTSILPYLPKDRTIGIILSRPWFTASVEKHKTQEASMSVH